LSGADRELQVQRHPRRGYDHATVWVDVWLEKGPKIVKVPKEDRTNKNRNTRQILGGGKGGRALNALRHGIFLQEPVIPGVENKREFRRFQSRVIEALAPWDEFQRWLAMRIARLAWRLNRVEMFEAAVIRSGQQQAEDETAKTIEQSGREGGFPWAPAGFMDPRMLELGLKTARSNLALLMQLPALAPETKVKRSKALDVLGVVATFAGVKLEDVVDFAAEKAEDVAAVLRHPLLRDWTPPEILGVIAAIAQRVDKDPEGLRQATALRLMTMSAFGEEEARIVSAARDHQRRLRLLPDSGELDRVLRYEAHLWRQLIQALHEYEALQARDRGESVPLARLDVQGLN
jgi:hypothetical protein